MAKNKIGNLDLCCSHPDFAASCLFIQKFGELLGLLPLDIQRLQDSFEDCANDVPSLISELHIYLLRRLKRNVPADKWEKQLTQFCDHFSYRDAWELESCGYAKIRMVTKMAIIRNLLEAQFDANLKFIERLSDLPEYSLRLESYGKDKYGFVYWLIQDDYLTVRIFKHEEDDETGSSWRCLVSSRDDLETLIEKLKQSLESTNENRFCPSPSGSSLQACDRDSYQSTPVKALDLEFNEVKSKPSISKLVVDSTEQPSTPLKSENNAENLPSETDLKTDIKQEQTTADTKQEETIDSKSAKTEAVTEKIDQSESPVSPANQLAQSADETTEDPDNGSALMDESANDSAALDRSVNQNIYSDSEDDIPLSQLKKQLRLMNSTRRAMNKAKLAREKQKLKQLRGKKKDRLIKKINKDTSSPICTPTRSSGRQKKPVVQYDMCCEESAEEELEDWLSDESTERPRGRNARRQTDRRTGTQLSQQNNIDEVENDDTPCTKCRQYTQPDLILLCDQCDCGWHTACLRPPLFYIPDDDWFCPTCEHTKLIEKLSSHLVKLDELVIERDKKMKRQEQKEKHALANGINPSNIITSTKNKQREGRERKKAQLDEYEYDSWEEDFGYNRTKRSCRSNKKISYKFEEYDKIMDSAIKSAGPKSQRENQHDPTLLDDIPPSLQFKKAPPGRSRGKDMSSILGADALTSSDEEEEKSLNNKDEGSDDEKENQEQETEMTGKPSKPTRNKKKTKFSNLDGSDIGEPDDEYNLSDSDQGQQSEEVESDESWAGETRRRSSRNKRPRKYEDDRDFINDGSLSDSDDNRRNKRKSAKRSTRTSAAAAQAAVRKRRNRVDLSEESAETTPVSSDDSEDSGRVKNRWNSNKTYGMRNKRSTEDKKRDRKRKRIVASFDSDESTNDEASDEDYIPTVAHQFDDPDDAAADRDAAVDMDAAGDRDTDEPDQEPVGDNRAKKAVDKAKKLNRIVSSSEEELDPSSQKITPSLDPGKTPENPTSPERSGENDVENSEKTSSAANAEQQSAPNNTSTENQPTQAKDGMSMKEEDRSEGSKIIVIAVNPLEKSGGDNLSVENEKVPTADTTVKEPKSKRKKAVLKKEKPNAEVTPQPEPQKPAKKPRKPTARYQRKKKTDTPTTNLSPTQQLPSPPQMTPAQLHSITPRTNSQPNMPQPPFQQIRSPGLYRRTVPQQVPGYNPSSAFSPPGYSSFKPNSTSAFQPPQYSSRFNAYVPNQYTPHTTTDFNGYPPPTIPPQSGPPIVSPQIVPIQTVPRVPAVPQTASLSSIVEPESAPVEDEDESGYLNLPSYFTGNETSS